MVIALPINILQFAGLLLDFTGAVILAVSEIASRKTISKISETYSDSNPYLKKYMEERNTYAIIGASLLIIGFMLQLIGAGLNLK